VNVKTLNFLCIEYKPKFAYKTSNGENDSLTLQKESNAKTDSNRNLVVCYCIGGVLSLAGSGVCGAIIGHAVGHDLQSTLEGAGIGVTVCILLIAYATLRYYQQDDIKENYTNDQTPTYNSI
jgi:hypothetical protein